MEIKASPSNHERNVQASHRSERRDEERAADLSSRKAAAEESERRVSDSAGQGNEARFFALESRQDAPVDSRQQVRAMRERVRQTYSEEENRAARDAIHEQMARDAQAEQRAQRNEAHQPIDLIA
ncbi:MAG: hypothetical protein GXP11_04650 [Gammaproteobacteria bacterium]|nr:hypothetical protein [Gammaproteobacteria bacterium]